MKVIAETNTAGLDFILGTESPVILIDIKHSSKEYDFITEGKQ
jgi:hypothetical protein